MRQGRPGITRSSPWLVAFIFGLLHGFGFAGTLTEVGLPRQAIPLALLFFNVGVEVRQLLFIAAAGLLVLAARRLPVQRPAWSWQALAYGIGFADATLTLLAEQLGILEVLTLDRRGFTVYRTRDGKPFHLVLDSP